MTPYNIRKEILIDAPINKVWDALTRPEIIAQYMFGTEAISDWSPGSDIVFQGEHNGQKYSDKGTILAYDIEQKLEYTFLSSFSNLEDKPENYSQVSYALSGMDDGETTLSVKQENLSSKEAAIHADASWNHVLDTMKEILEK